MPVNQPELAFVYSNAQAAMATLDRVATVATYNGTVTYPNTGLGQALKAVAGSMVRGIGTRVFYVTTGGFDTHSAQNPNQTNGSYYTLMGTLNDALLAFYQGPHEPGALREHAGAVVLRNSAVASRRTAATAPTTARRQ